MVLTLDLLNEMVGITAFPTPKGANRLLYLREFSCERIQTVAIAAIFAIQHEETISADRFMLLIDLNSLN